jgi:hypothetical protein
VGAFIVPSYLSPDDFRVKGEKRDLCIGIGILILVLLFITALSIGIVTAALVVVTAIVVWVQQNQLLGGAAKVSEKQFPEIHSIAQQVADRLGMKQPARDFQVLGFLAPYVVVRRRSDGRKGSLEFQHNPRFYFGFSPH